MKNTKIEANKSFLILGISTIGIAAAAAMIAHGTINQDIGSFDKGFLIFAGACIGIPSTIATVKNCYELLNEVVDNLVDKYYNRNKRKIKI